MFWTKEDSNNLASIARSLEKLTERELERAIVIGKGHTEPFTYRILDRVKEQLNKDKIKVTESSSLEDEALEESIKRGQNMQAKVTEAHRTGNIPFVVEDLFDAEELENL